MKKFFTLIAVAAMALTANAQKIVFDATAGKQASYEVDGFKMTYVDQDGKAAVDANSQYFGTADAYENFTARFKTGAKSGAKSNITLTCPKAGTLKVYARSASGSATDRNLILTQGETELYNKVVKDEDAVKVTIEEVEKNVFPVISVEVAAGDVAVTYPTGSLNFYAFELISGTTGIETVKAAEAEGVKYNMAGQKVGADYKGVVIMNGKKMVNK